MIPLVLAFPGATELLVILLIAVVLFGIPLVLLGGGLYLYRQTQSDAPESEELRALRREIERLREEVERLDDEE